ncbi:MAG: bifunctional UDP-3-O-[3-hydroxymyristoyl] N-acetylglucosamine deacetylase/3-hydroxyacyl-ACP dehydratase [Opitutales bacterium]
MKQRTILREASISGKALHTGEKVNLTLKPAEPNKGIRFRRTDLYGKPEICPDVDLVTDVVRSTTISSGHTKVHTIEHVMSALHGGGIDNVLVEMDASEPPILDGSAREYANLIAQAEPVEQDTEREYLTLSEPVSVTRGSSSLIALPHEGLRVTCTSADDRGVHTQHVSLDIDPEVYAAQVAPARTFTIYEDIEELLKLGKIQGGSLDSAVVIKGDTIVSKEPLRFKDEFARHKVLDVIGDIMLLGKPLKAHIIAVRTGHALNVDLCRAIRQSLAPKPKPKPSEGKPAPKPLLDGEMDIRRILDTIPHRYPFVMVDRVVSVDSDTELTAIKNVSINEPYFMGHFPGQPVMPGVLQIEAMAQAAGLLMLRKVSTEGKIAFFMSCDKVKFRQAVTPGDQLEIKVKLTKARGSIGVAEGKCMVGGKTVSSAELMFTVVDAGGDT